MKPWSRAQHPKRPQDSKGRQELPPGMGTLPSRLHHLTSCSQHTAQEWGRTLDLGRSLAGEDMYDHGFVTAFWLNFYYYYFNIYLYFLFVWLWWISSWDMWDLVPWPRIKLQPPALGAWSLSQWTTREAPGLVFTLWCCNSQLRLAHHDKTAETEGLKYQTFIFSQFWRLQVQD